MSTSLTTPEAREAMLHAYHDIEVLPCSTCKGRGFTKPKLCKSCNGGGRVIHRYSSKHRLFWNRVGFFALIIVEALLCYAIFHPIK